MMCESRKKSRLSGSFNISFCIFSLFLTGAITNVAAKKSKALGKGIFSIFSRKPSPSYTPLLFFGVPKGHEEEMDDMEKLVSKVEKDIDVKVERFDIMRNRMARILYEQIDSIDNTHELPLLYNRESRQTIYGKAEEARVRAWAKGRFLPSLKSEEEIDETTMQDDEYGYYDDGLTPLERQGRERMERRMEDGAKKGKEESGTDREKEGEEGVSGKEEENP